MEKKLVQDSGDFSLSWNHQKRETEKLLGARTAILLVHFSKHVLQIE